MSGWDWTTIYLVCFGVGLVMSLFAFFGGALHLHLGHFHLHAHGVGKGGVRGGSAHQLTPFNGFTLMAFLCWFGGAGYLMHRGGVFGAALVLVFSALSGIAGSSLVFWFLTRVLLPRSKTLEPADTELTGVIGRLSGAIPVGGVGELLYSQNGARRSVPVKSENGEAVELGAEVVVMSHARGVGSVRRWSDFEHGLLRDDGPRETEGARR